GNLSYPRVRREKRLVEPAHPVDGKAFAERFRSFNKLFHFVNRKRLLGRPATISQFGHHVQQEELLADMFRRADKTLHMVFELLHGPLLPRGRIKTRAEIGGRRIQQEAKLLATQRLRERQERPIGTGTNRAAVGALNQNWF